MKHIILTFNLLVMVTAIAFSQQPQLENPGFEEWEEISPVVNEPLDWSSLKTSDDPFLSTAAPIVWEQSNDAHSGQYSVKLTNVTTFGIVATGTITNGRIHPDFYPPDGYSFTDTEDAQWNTPLAARPDSLTGYYKYYPRANDSAQAKALLHVYNGKIPANDTDTNWIAFAEFVGGGTDGQWVRFSAPFVYTDERVPEYILLILTAGNGTNGTDSSQAYYDDIALVYNSSGIDDPTLAEYPVYVSGKTVYLDHVPQDYLNDAYLTISDICGRTIFSDEVTSSHMNIESAGIREGIYIINIYNSKQRLVSKVFIR